MQQLNANIIHKAFLAALKHSNYFHIEKVEWLFWLLLLKDVILNNADDTESIEFEKREEPANPLLTVDTWRQVK